MPPMKSGRDCTRGSIPRHLLAIALPMLIGNFIQSGYTIIDAIWVGRVVGKAAMGAIAVSFPIMFLFIAVCAGTTMATTILISQYYGAKNMEQLEKTIGTSFFFAFVLGTVLSVAGILFSDSILLLLNTPVSIIPVASIYLRINFGGFIIMYAGFLIASILRGIGDSRTPLIFMIVGVCVNAVLDPLLITGVGPFPRWGLGGAAVASIAGQFCAVIVGYIYLLRRGNVVAVRFSGIVWNWKIIQLILKIGFPSMIQQSAVSLGIATITGIVNGFGDSATAAFGAAGRIDTVSFFPAMSIGMAVSILCGQNIGAGKYERVQAIFRWGVLMTCVISGFFSIFYLTIPHILLSAFITDPEVISIGSGYLRIVSTGSILFAVAFVANGVINGAGHTRITLVITLVSLWGIRVPAALLLSKTSLGITGVWIGILIGFGAIMLISTAYYRSGIWRKKVIQAEAEVPVPEANLIIEPATEA